MSLPTTTKAVRLFEYGGPEKLVFGDYPLPQLGERDVPPVTKTIGIVVVAPFAASAASTPTETSHRSLPVPSFTGDLRRNGTGIPSWGK